LTILLGNTARDLRDRLGLTQRAAAEALGISFVHLCNIEKDRAAPSQALIDKYRELWGIDLYVLAWCSKQGSSQLPAPMRKAADALAQGWREHIERMVSRHDKSAGG
jgi:transcriptional regulator with XRE-family HTH domain